MTSTRARRSPQVPAQFLGYSLQTTRALVRLLSAPPGTFVSVEVLDDVAQSGAGGHATLVQTKSVGHRTNPIADRSPELWKTLANWVRAVQQADIDVDNTDFEIFLSKKRSGSIAESFAAAHTVAEAHTALIAARSALEPEAERTRSVKRRPSLLLKPHLDAVFGDSPTAARVIHRMTLQFGSGRSYADVLRALEPKLISTDVLPVVANQMLGWVKARIDDLIEQQKPAAISTDVFLAELLAFVRRVDRFEILNSFAPLPTKEDLELELQSRLYVRQLELIGSDYDTKLAAATDYLRASVDRSVWAAKGLVHRDSFLDLEDRLQRIWHAKRQAVEVSAAQHAPERRGTLLYAECCLAEAALDGRPVPGHFGPGCFHSLADALSVGWHPEFKARLGSKEELT